MAGERIPVSYPRSVMLLLIALSVGIALVLLLFVEGVIVQVAAAAAAFFVLRRFWSATGRKRNLASRGFHAGRRVGHHWVYEELHEGEVVAIELPLAYVGRGEHEILIPGEQTWPVRMPAWARERREEIVERLGTVFKRSDMRIDD